jgi:enamine deaminase RidA (YjgF/YER057c/UK114 family)
MSPSLPRRDLLFATGLLGLAALPAGARGGSTQPPAGSGGTSPEQRLRELGITLPPAPNPVATYVTRVQVGELLFTSGHGPGGATGKVGRELDLAAGRAAARETGLLLLATVRDHLGSLDRVVRVVKILGMVNCTEDFTQQPQVINGCSDLFVEVFGEDAGKGARSAVGMVSLPGAIPVEIEVVLQVRS